MNIKNKLSSLMYAPLALALLAACSSDDVVENNQPATQGQTLTINATTGSEDGTRVSFDESTYATKWETSDKVYIYAGGTDKVGEFTVKSITNDHNAVLTGTISGELSTTTNITGYIYNTKVNTSDNGSAAAVTNFGKHIDVDYSEQKGTWEDAMSRCVLFGQGTYDPNSKDQSVDMTFEYKTTFLKLILNFGDESINTTATMCLTGDNMVSNSRINTIGTNAGKTNYAKDLFINIKEVAITNGKATVYVAMYPRDLNNVYLQATLKNNDVYDFNISNNAAKAVALASGKVYTIERTGIKEETSFTWDGEGSETNPYLIKSVADFKLLANNLKNGVEGTTYGYKGNYFKLNSDIIINSDNWTPIGNNKYAFRGIFDGGNHTISGNITINGLSEAKNGLDKNEGAGLFGAVSTGCVIKNLKSKLNVTSYSNNNNTGSTFAGSIIGRVISDGVIENCVNKGNVKSTAHYVGGLIGSISLATAGGANGVIVNACYNEGDVENTTGVSTTNAGTGGLIGIVDGVNAKGLPVQVYGCYVTGATLTCPNNKMVGGILGMMTNTTQADQAKFTSCWTSKLTFTGTPKFKASLITTANATGIVYNVSTCWTDDNNNKFVTPNYDDNTGSYKPTPTLTECYSASSKKLADFVPTMNKVWGSSTYEFNTDGTIKTK